MENKKIKILHVIDYFHRTGGTETHLAQLATRLPDAGIDCTIVIFDMGDNPLIADMQRAGIKVIHLPVRREYTPHAMAKAIELYRLIRRERFDIVQTFHQKSDTYGAVVARLAGVKHIISSKRDTGHLRKPRHFFLNRRLRSLFERVIVVADAVGDAVVKSDHLDRARLVKIYNGVDTTRFRPPSAAEAAAARAKFGLQASDFVVGMVAGFRPEKNHRMLFEGALAAVPRIPGMKVLAVGAGPLIEDFRSRYSGDLAVFAGDTRDVTTALWAMDVGTLLPSMNEGFSNAVIEKMGAGLPVIVTDVGGNAEAVFEGQNGYVIAPNDTGKFTAALIELHADAERRRAMGRHSRKLVEERFSLPQMCATHVALYRSLCASGAVAPVPERG